MNKIDLISDEKETTELEDLKMKIHGINSLATIICTTRCLVDLDEILNRESYGGKVSKTIELDFFFFSPFLDQLQHSLFTLLSIFPFTFRVTLIWKSFWRTASYYHPVAGMTLVYPPCPFTNHTQLI